MNAPSAAPLGPRTDSRPRVQQFPQTGVPSYLGDFLLEFRFGQIKSCIIDKPPEGLSSFTHIEVAHENSVSNYIDY